MPTKKKYPRGFEPKSFVMRAKASATSEDWQRVGDLFWGVRATRASNEENDYVVEYFVTTTNIHASEAPQVTQDFWEKQLAYNLRNLERKGK